MYGDTWENGCDLVAVERAASLRGELPPLNPGEELRAVRMMREAKQPITVIAARMGLCARTVLRWSEAMRLGPTADEADGDS